MMNDTMVELFRRDLEIFKSFCQLFKVTLNLNNETSSEEEKEETLPSKRMSHQVRRGSLGN